MAYKGLRAIIGVEERAAARNGGTIKAIKEPVCPRAFRVIALPALSNRASRSGSRRRDEQERRLLARTGDPLGQCKLSPTDLESHAR